MDRRPIRHWHPLAVLAGALATGCGAPSSAAATPASLACSSAAAGGTVAGATGLARITAVDADTGFVTYCRVILFCVEILMILIVMMIKIFGIQGFSLRRDVD